jgi:predicted transcriptional regulator
VIEAFGNKSLYYGNKKGWELGSATVKKLSKAFSELNFSDHLGLEHADVVEIERPEHIRDEIKALSENWQSDILKIRVNSHRICLTTKIKTNR